MTKKRLIYLIICFGISWILHYFLINGLPKEKYVAQTKSEPMVISLSDFKEFTSMTDLSAKDLSENSLDSVRGDFYAAGKGGKNKSNDLSKCKKKYIGIGIATESKRVNGKMKGVMMVDDYLLFEVVKVNPNSPANDMGIKVGEFVERNTRSLLKMPVGSTLNAHVYSPKTKKMRIVTITSRELCYK